MLISLFFTPFRRQGVRLAKFFEEKVRNDVRFEIPADRYLGMVVFRLKVSHINKLGSLQESRILHLNNVN